MVGHAVAADKAPMDSVALPAELDAQLAVRSRKAYGQALSELDRWAPLAALVCRQYQIEPGHIVLGQIGTYPTCLIDQTYVVKLCGPWYGGYINAAAERAVFCALEPLGADHLPRLLARGYLNGVESSVWYYLLSTFKPGEPVGAIRGELPPEALADVASELGRFMRQVHVCGASGGGALPLARRHFGAWVRGQYDDLAAKLAERATLPERWVRQALAYVLPPEQLLATEHGCLLHGDMTADHILIEPSPDGPPRWSLIDWGDARLGDPYYELAALHLDCFAGQRRLLGAFLDAYGWPWDDSAIRRAMSYLLLHEFDVLGPFVREHPELRQIETLAELATALWAL